MFHGISTGSKFDQNETFIGKGFIGYLDRERYQSTPSTNCENLMELNYVKDNSFQDSERFYTPDV